MVDTAVTNACSATATTREKYDARALPLNPMIMWMATYYDCYCRNMQEMSFRSDAGSPTTAPTASPGSTGAKYSRELPHVCQVNRHRLREPGLLISCTHAHGSRRRTRGRHRALEHGRGRHEGGGAAHEERCHEACLGCHDVAFSRRPKTNRESATYPRRASEGNRSMKWRRSLSCLAARGFS